MTRGGKARIEAVIRLLLTIRKRTSMTSEPSHGSSRGLFGTIENVPKQNDDCDERCSDVGLA